MDHAASLRLAPQKVQQCPHHPLEVDPVGLGAPRPPVDLDARRIDLVIDHALVGQPAMQPVSVESGLVARHYPYRFAAERRLPAPLRKPHRQRRHVTSRDRITAQLLRAGQYYAEHPLRFAQFKKQRKRWHNPPRRVCQCDRDSSSWSSEAGWWCNSNPNLSTTRLPIGSEERPLG